MSVPAGNMTDALSGATPQQIQQILAMGNNPQQMELLQQQMARANALRNTPMPQGQSSWRGSVYTKPNPLQIIGNVANKAVGQQQMNQAQQQMQQLMQQQQGGRQSYMDIIRQMMQRQGGGAPGAPPPGGGGVPAGGDDGSGGLF